MNYTIEDVEASSPVDIVGLVAAMHSRMTQLDAENEGSTFSDADREEFASLEGLIAAANARKAEWDYRKDRLASLAQEPARQVHIGDDLAPRRSRAVSNLPDDIYDLSEYRKRTMGEPDAMKALVVDGAKKAVEHATFAHPDADVDKTKAHLHRLLSTVDDPEALSRLILGTGSPLYGRAFAHGAKTQFADFGTPDMRAAITSGGTTAGGYRIPYTLDPTLILTSNGQANPLRQIARVETITGNTWKGLTTTGVTVARGAEAAAVTEGSPVYGQPSVSVVALKAEIQFSIEADEDYPNIGSDMAMVLQDAKDAEEAESFVNDTGAANHTEGIIYGLAATSDVGTGAGLTIDDPNRLVARLPDRYEPNARWMGHRAVFTELDRLARAAGFNEPSVALGSPPTLLGYPKHYSSAMDSDFVTDGNDILLFGDFRNFLIVDRVGMSIELDPHVRDGDGKWTGQRAFLAHWRNASLILVDNAFRLLKVGVVTS